MLIDQQFYAKFIYFNWFPKISVYLSGRQSGPIIRYDHPVSILVDVSLTYLIYQDLPTLVIIVQETRNYLDL